ncbi:hypothetical protein [Metabacillus sp. 113a]|uniref:hypothetical protein n=2 Tax=unclassified Metabacillus TaxID=2675274 RepID=UPI003CE9D06F
MIMLAAAIFILVLYSAFEWYQRYIPVRNIPCLPLDRMDGQLIVDVRDYNNRNDIVQEQTLNIPIPYLQKAFVDIQGSEIYLIAATKLERNMSIRFLKRKGIAVKGYTLTDESGCGKGRQ